MKILITDDVHQELIEGFKTKSYVVDFLPNISLIEVHKIIQEYEGLVINSKIIVDQALLAKASKLKCVARLGSGKEILDLQELKLRGIKVITTPEANCNAVAEQALGMFLALLRNIPKADQEVKNFIWEREANRGSELSNLKFGIVGYGHTGRRFVEILSGFGCPILVYDKFVQIKEAQTNMRIVNTLEALNNCDVISLHVSLLPENRHLVNKQFIERMNRPFYLINTSRGLVIETKALIEGLQSGKIKGACLDVFENEKVGSFLEEEKDLYQSLYHFPNTILSPHIAGWTFESKVNIARSILANWD